MAVIVSDVRSETQIPASIISDDDVTYLIAKVGDNGLAAVCAYVAKLVIRKYRGRSRIRVGNVWEDIDYKALRGMVREYQSQAGYVIDDDVTSPDSFFTREGI